MTSDICVSGINHGGNLGDDATYSGTVAALWKRQYWCSGIALSLVARDNLISQRRVDSYCGGSESAEEGLPEGTLLNINIHLAKSKV